MIKSRTGQEQQNAAPGGLITATSRASARRANEQVELWENGLHLTGALKVDQRDEERWKEAGKEHWGP